MPNRFGNPPGSYGVGEDVFVGIESVRGVQKKTNILDGNDSPNVLIGGGRTDALRGASGNDLLFGVGGDDSLHGDAGDDFLDGGSPHGRFDADILNGGEGDDTCIDSQPDFVSECEEFQPSR